MVNRMGSRGGWMQGQACPVDLCHHTADRWCEHSLREGEGRRGGGGGGREGVDQRNCLKG